MLKALQGSVSVVLMLRLMLILRSLKLLHGLLELEKGFIMVFFGLILLSLKEIELALPKSFLLIHFRLELSMCLLHLIVL